ncbi:Citrate synthase [Ruminiclostridium papyrosolvens DSM 2782]|uniref:Citrate synthase n=1 Tax=Ruminiclostridium papyrosolvens DSM 2782 TaxID=588581 RepID=F1TC70_9FIRM|nr:citrate/2-methylcitrate synthase [Ruminiclostridium papyrosolvens]EGD47985.1 Citrate synthase [Ruminiclostridium papyrosolvens DSM 2782]WES35124.1 citrate/2-methylcitrate synthase [Ruminiclostridium papyrosolvens DSM 2782]
MEKKLNDYIDKMVSAVDCTNRIDPEYFTKYSVKKGLRNSDGSGVLVGLTEIGEVHGYVMYEGERKEDEGRLVYRGIDVFELVRGFQQEKRFGFEEVCYLLLFGKLPNSSELTEFTDLLGGLRALPSGFTEDMILKAPSSDIMNKLARSVLVSYSYDEEPDGIDPRNLLRQSIELIARFPTMAAYGFQAKSHYYGGQSLYIHSPVPELSTAENILHMIRPDNKYTQSEAEILDLALVLHAEHGGGNNSTFAARVVSSTETDTYSAIAAAVGSLKGPKHGGANIKAMNMLTDIKEHVEDWADDDEIRGYLVKIINKEAYDGAGLIYGMGHAVYTLSDPRTILLKEKAHQLAIEKGREREFLLYDAVERIAPDVFAQAKGTTKNICANVDLYSGFVYDALGIPTELFTPLFAVARIVGWCAHRIEEVVCMQKIIRPAYKSISKPQKFLPIEDR